MSANMPSSPSKKQQHAIVIGGSMAGLLAARVLADHFDQVTVVERDSWPQDATGRKGLPQARHVHILLARGRQVIEQLFPGFSAELLANGAQRVDVIEDIEWYGPIGWSQRIPSGIITTACPRDQIDWVIRRRLQSTYPAVRFLADTEVVGLVAASSNAVVNGVRVVDGRNLSQQQVLNADLVVDASGRGSKAPQWLGKLGYQPPSETVITAFSGYASRIYARPAGVAFAGILMQPLAPDFRRGGALFPLDDKRWIVTLSGSGRDYPPTDEAGFMEFAHSLRHPLLWQTIKDAEPLSPIAGSRSTENKWRHYEQLKQRPEGFIVLGDAACALNPVYGQGMSNAAQGAVELARCLREQKRLHPTGEMEGFAQRFQRGLAKVNQPVWLLATGADFQYREAIGKRRTLLTRLNHSGIEALIRCANRDPVIYKRLVEVMHLLKQPVTLITPRAVVAAIRDLFIKKEPTASERLNQAST